MMMVRVMIMMVMMRRRRRRRRIRNLEDQIPASPPPLALSVHDPDDVP
jgi:hypothetical protein